MPTAVVYAAQDEMFEPGWIRFMARELFGVEPIELPGGHFPMLEAAGRLAAVLAGLGPVGQVDDPVVVGL